MTRKRDNQALHQRWPDHPAACVVYRDVDMTARLERRRDQVVGHAGLAEFADEAAASPSWLYAQPTSAPLSVTLLRWLPVFAPVQVGDATILT
jgi:hypothetical protein